MITCIKYLSVDYFLKKTFVCWLQFPTAHGDGSSKIGYLIRPTL